LAPANAGVLLADEPAGCLYFGFGGTCAAPSSYFSSSYELCIAPLGKIGHFATEISVWRHRRTGYFCPAEGEDVRAKDVRANNADSLALRTALWAPLSSLTSGLVRSGLRSLPHQRPKGGHLREIQPIAVTACLVAGRTRARRRPRRAAKDRAPRTRTATARVRSRERGGRRLGLDRAAADGGARPRVGVICQRGLQLQHDRRGASTRRVRER
jgi:hypothetical protein